ncbi:hypothetical protein QQP08_020361 [Theobroma cacao]|nr:hypothetical protein QQP08_020361 [Theobroma cacao]
MPLEQQQEEDISDCLSRCTLVDGEELSQQTKRINGQFPKRKDHSVIKTLILGVEGGAAMKGTIRDKRMTAHSGN